MSTPTKNINEAPVESNLDSLFSQIIDQLKADHFMMCTDTATNETKEFYTALLNGDEFKIISGMRVTSSLYFIKRIVLEYLTELKLGDKLPLKLAMGLSDSKLLVWSEIEDEDDKMEDALLIAEAKVNGKYHANGFYINSTIIEKSDNIPVPNHYQTIIA